MTDELSIADAMELLGVTKATIYNHIKRGNLHPIKKRMGIGLGGRRVWLHRSEVIALRDGVDNPHPASAEETQSAPKTKHTRKAK